MQNAHDDTKDSGELVRLQEGIYVNGTSGAKRVHVKQSAVGLVVGRYGPQVLVAINQDQLIIVNEGTCEKV